MKSYRLWQQDESFRESVVPVVEWSVQSLWRRSMGNNEKQQMDRIGTMLGRNNKYKIGPDFAQQGDDFMNALNQKTNVDSLLKMAANNSPIRQAYDRMGQIKKSVNQINKGDLNQAEIAMLIKILANCHKGGEVPFADLNKFWRNITSVMDDRNTVNQQAVEPAKSNDVHTPAHLLKIFFGIGGGIFSAPSNLPEIRTGSAEILKLVDPNNFNQLFKKRFGYNPSDVGQTNQTQNSGSGQNANMSAVSSQIAHLLQVAKASNNQLAPEIEKLLQQVQGNSTPAPQPPKP